MYLVLDLAIKCPWSSYLAVPHPNDYLLVFFTSLFLPPLSLLSAIPVSSLTTKPELKLPILSSDFPYLFLSSNEWLFLEPSIYLPFWGSKRGWGRYLTSSECPLSSSGPYPIAVKSKWILLCGGMERLPEEGTCEALWSLCLENCRVVLCVVTSGIPELRRLRKDPCESYASPSYVVSSCL